MDKLIYQCSVCERGYESHQAAKNCQCPEKVILKWQCPYCGDWWDIKLRTECCGHNTDLISKTL